MTVTDPVRQYATEDARRTAAEGDLREFLRQAEAMGELARIDEADPHLEMGALYELSLEHAHPPVLLFDRIKGYAPGYRVLMNVRESRVLDEGEGIAAVQAFRLGRRRQGGPIAPEEVATGPVFEHVLEGAAVNALAFPAPKWHELDGGPYIGTECMVITKDRDGDWVNAGTYRVQVQDERTVTVFIEPGKHGSVMRQQYGRGGGVCGRVLCFGRAPILGRVAGAGPRYGESEFATAGGRIGRPIPIVRGPLTGLPFPADAELVFEGVMPPREVDARPEGPF